ncbi:MAG: hypothetical protein IKO98_00345, partial [Bacteroidales bacterium]|nr:hypothetical protein [Bacteroidales bacterium]
LKKRSLSVILNIFVLEIQKCKNNLKMDTDIIPNRKKRHIFFIMRPEQPFPNPFFYYFCSIKRKADGRGQNRNEF